MDNTPNKLLDLAKQVVAKRKRSIAIWRDIDYYETHGIERSLDEKILEPINEDITLGRAIHICLTYPSWLSKNERKLAKMEDSLKKEELAAAIQARRATFNYVKSLKDDGSQEA